MSPESFNWEEEEEEEEGEEDSQIFWGRRL